MFQIAGTMRSVEITSIASWRNSKTEEIPAHIVTVLRGRRKKQPSAAGLAGHLHRHSTSHSPILVYPGTSSDGVYLRREPNALV